MTRFIEVGIDGTTWNNERGFGRFTREIVKALAARQSGFRYTLVVDRDFDGTIPDGLQVLEVRTRRTVSEAAVGSGSRSPTKTTTSRGRLPATASAAGSKATPRCSYTTSTTSG